MRIYRAREHLCVAIGNETNASYDGWKRVPMSFTPLQKRRNLVGIHRSSFVSFSFALLFRSVNDTNESDAKTQGMDRSRRYKCISFDEWSLLNDLKRLRMAVAHFDAFFFDGSTILGKRRTRIVLI